MILGGLFPQTWSTLFELNNEVCFKSNTNKATPLFWENEICMCVYIHIHTHTYIYTHTYIHIHSHTHTHLYIHTYIYTHAFTHIPIYTHKHTYTYTYIKLCAFSCFPKLTLAHHQSNSLLSFTGCHLICKTDWRYLFFKITHVPFYSPGPRFSHCGGQHLPGKRPHVSTLTYWNVSRVQFPDGKH